MAQYVNDPVPKYRQEDIPKTVRQLHGYTVGLTDQLQYLLANLDADNVPELDSIQKRLTDTQGNVTRLDLTAEGLSLAVRDHDDRFASLDVTVGGIQTAVGTMDGALSTLTQTARGLESRVSTAEGQISTVTQTAAGLTTWVGNAEGSISSLQQTASGLTSQISSAQGDISSLRQTASGLQSQINNASNEISSVTQTANRLQTRVSNAEGDISSLEQTAKGLSSTVSDLDGKYTRIQQTVDSIDIEGEVNAILQNGCAEINFVYNGIDVANITAINRSLFEIWAIDELYLGSAGISTLSANDSVTIECPNDDINIEGGDEGTKIWVSSSRYWTFGRGGIYYCDKYGDYQSKVQLIDP